MSVAAAWTTLDRESFFAAIERHRRAAWRVSALSMLANTALAFVVATLMSPLFYALIALLFDLINLAIPTPNLMASFEPVLDRAVDHPESIRLAEWVSWVCIAALPGLVWMAFLMAMLSRVLRVSAACGARELAGRAPDTTVLAEQRFANVIGEMAVAAALPAPRILVTERQSLNAAVIGRDESHATVIVSTALLTALDRDQMQGVAAHLIASIANGDMRIGMRASLTLCLFGTIARFSSLLSDDEGWDKLRRMGRMLLRPAGLGAQALAASIADPFEPDANESRARTVSRGENKTHARQRNWRALLWAPLAGPVVFTGFLGGLVSTMILAPLLALVWRQRKYMADAIAVRLTRDPDTLANALMKLGSGAAFAPWAAHLCVAAANTAKDTWLGSSMVPMIPSDARRLRALRKLGAHVSPPSSRIPWQFLLLVSPLIVFAAVLLVVAIVLTAGITIPISMLMTGLPFSVLHLLLRWLGR
jgi:Zn-dependent protease with chaperone function